MSSFEYRAQKTNKKLFDIKRKKKCTCKNRFVKTDLYDIPKFSC